MKSALVIGADEFFGLSFCERLMEEGISIDVKLQEASDEKKRLYLEERLMWLVRNQHFCVIEKDAGSGYDKIFIQYPEKMPERARDELPEDTPVFLLLYEHQEDEAVKKEAEEKGFQTIVLPDMYGPWNAGEEDEESRESGFFVDDVASQLAVYMMEKDPSPLQFKRQITEEEAASKIEEWKRQMTTIFDKK
ncbi:MULTISPECIES: hypothetical protein [Bacillus]|uniref:NAD(P) binding enzyme n=1 Tax=Bacillus glycinifermentans TaxID=1664069 RepID=A0AAJ3YX17_9BACI|nr:MULTISPECIES: hypothetical protein [Bacillus]KKB73364.1 hypothetical protein TH62_12795 [Bacillus sp. TH008]MDU0069572.1 hypothetical protein [Bacillus sp. IG6]MED8017449.1 hypothetical protein [Bacillus glycinifermentans]QAT64598.1 hypothetical protein EQZ20_06560 [Bacillus glycinifermentans]WKB78549.1 hypothetical protein QYM22_06785 [Bacillus glycinifermentans]